MLTKEIANKADEVLDMYNNVKRVYAVTDELDRLNRELHNELEAILCRNTVKVCGCGRCGY